MNTTEGPDGIEARHIQLTDLEDSAHCPPPGNLIGAQLGNWMWRSPEAHATGPMNKSSDIFIIRITILSAPPRIFALGPAERVFSHAGPDRK